MSLFSLHNACVPGWLPVQGYLLSYQLLVKIKKKLLKQNNSLLLVIMFRFGLFIDCSFSQCYENQAISFSSDLDAADCLKCYSASKSTGTHTCVDLITDNKIELHDVAAHSDILANDSCYK